MNEVDIVKRIDILLEPYKSVLGVDYLGYISHVKRVVLFAYLLNPLEAPGIEKLIIAGAFHDLGIWTDNTIDYLKPSEKLATDYLYQHNLSEYIDDVVAMIDDHHKITPVKENELAELFRKADLVDISLGVIAFGIEKNLIKRVKSDYPNSGFHKRLLILFLQQLKMHPFNPLPMMKI